MKAVSVAIGAGCRVELAVDFGRDESLRDLEHKLPEDQPAASFVCEIDLERLRPLFRKALNSRGKRAALLRAAIVIRTTGTRPVRDGAPVTVREPRRAPEHA